jgi:hypothetical protein
MMSAKDWFGIVVRNIGVWNIATGLASFSLFIGQRAKWFRIETDETYTLLYSITDIGIGLALLLGANSVVEMAYRERQSETTGNAKAE